jgi:hypothetical protein
LMLAHDYDGSIWSGYDIISTNHTHTYSIIL